mgnify:CR=1 FL=1
MGLRGLCVWAGGRGCVLKEFWLFLVDIVILYLGGLCIALLGICGGLSRNLSIYF